MRDEERDRLEQEEFEEKSFLSRFERILVAVDKSPSGSLAGRISAHFAALRKMPVTVLSVEQPSQQASDRTDVSKPKTGEIAEEIKSNAERTAAGVSKDDAKDGDVHVTTTSMDGDLEALLAEGAKKGHDMLFVGVEPTAAPEGGFDKQISLMTNAFTGTTAIASQRGAMPDDDSALRILVPISGTERSTRAAEFALVIAKATGAKIAVIYIREPQQVSVAPRVSDISNAHVAAFKRIDEIASYSDVAVEKIIQESGSPELSILRHARKGRFNLIILGVSRRAGERLSYGSIADTLLETADRSFVLVETD
jgi:nucleotide-binding universal stress UspA family protein